MMSEFVDTDSRWMIDNLPVVRSSMGIDSISMSRTVESARLAQMFAKVEPLLVGYRGNSWLSTVTSCTYYFTFQSICSIHATDV